LDTDLLFALGAGIIILGFLGETVFRKIGMSSSIFLILMGVVLGPVFHLAPTRFLSVLTPFAVLTLLMVFLYSGLVVKWSAITTVGGRAFLLTALYTGLSIAGITWFGVMALRWPVLEALLLGTVIGGQTSTSVIGPLVRVLNLGDTAADTLTLESVMNSIVGITLFLGFLGVYTVGGFSAITLQPFVGSLVSSVTSGIVTGGIFGVGALLLFRRLEEQTYSYILTVGLALLDYVIATMAAGANGYIAVFVFGFIVGNYALINKIQKTQLRLDGIIDGLKRFQGETTFLLNTIFFVFLGMMFETVVSAMIPYFIFAILLLAIIIGSRAAAVYASTAGSEALRPYRGVMVFLSAQGVVQAVLAILVFDAGTPFGGMFIDLVTYTIIMTNIVTMAASITSDHGKGGFKDFIGRLEAEHGKDTGRHGP
jgi:NhaP-type Na+/H+ or K+/H+ antiporter